MVSIQIRRGFDGGIFQKMLQDTPQVLRKPASKSTAMRKPYSFTSTVKRPASTASQKSQQVSNKMHLRNFEASRIFIADETHLNEHKPNVLAKFGRPQPEQVWLWGAVLHGHLKTHFLSVFYVIMPMHSMESRAGTGK